MKNIILKPFLIIAMAAFLVGCKVPSKDQQSSNLLEWSGDFLTKLNDLDKKEKMKLLKDEIFTKKQLLALNENSTIRFYTKDEIKSDFIQTLSNDSIIFKKPIYATKKYGKTFFSFDTKEWFYVKASDMKKAFKLNYKIETALDDNKKNLDVFLTAGVDIKDEYLIKKDLKIDKPLVKLDPYLFTYKKGERNKFPSLYKNIVYIPENTVLFGELNISGNIVEVKKDSDSIKLTALRDVYFYNDKKMFNISFDREKWNFSLSKVKLDKEIDIKTNENEVNYIFNITLNYKDNEKI